IMAHFRHIAPAEEWDTPKNEYWDTCSVGLRKFSTTHLMRKNCWWWIIRLDDTTTSIGVVFDKNEVKFDDYQQFFLNQIANDAQLSVMTQHAERGKISHVETVPYVCQKLYSKGIALIGESGAFLDPLISPGIELISQQTIWLAELLTREKKTGKFQPSAWEKYSKIFFNAYESRLSIYEPAYHYMHSFDIFSAWLKQGNFAYFGTVVYPAILFKQRLKQPFRFNFMERLAMRYFRSRFRQISEKRMIQNRTSDTKPYEIKYSGVRVPGDIRFLFIPFYLLFKAVWAYVILEGKELFFRNL
ncbi:MAG: tryptophan 7-halogenase, partial [Bacteroidetes bacterium]|nr:tryptophan 7-halogenase [Bacteroidota bacterium]